MNIIQGASPENSNARGDNNQVITRVPETDKNFNQVLGHETAHQLMTRSGAAEHKLISTDGLDLSPKAIDAILDDALLDKQPIQKTKP